MGTPLAADTKREVDAMLTTLRMAERHKRWGLFYQVLTFIKEADGLLAYLGPGTYALSVPPHTTPKDPE